MSPPPDLDRITLQRLARLVALELSEAELAAFETELAALTADFTRLAVEVDRLEAAEPAPDLTNDLAEDLADELMSGPTPWPKLRSDEAEAPLTVEQVQALGTDHADGPAVPPVRPS